MLPSGFQKVKTDKALGLHTKALFWWHQDKTFLEYDDAPRILGFLANFKTWMLLTYFVIDCAEWIVFLIFWAHEAVEAMGV